MRGPEIDPAELLRLIADTVSFVEDYLEERSGSLWDHEVPARGKVDDPSAALPSPRTLRLQSDKLLGEILIQLGFLTEEQLAKGLQIQRASGERIGEALVATGALTWEQVNRAREIQDQLRRTCVTR